MANLDRQKIPKPYRKILDWVTPTKLLIWQMHITFLWLALVIPSILFWKESILWIIFISLWANIASHFVGALLTYMEGADEEGNLE